MKQMKKENNENKNRISQAINYLFDSSFGLLLRLSYKFPFEMHLKVFGLSAPEVVTFVASMLSPRLTRPHCNVAIFPLKYIGLLRRIQHIYQFDFHVFSSFLLIVQHFCNAQCCLLRSE